MSSIQNDLDPDVYIGLELPMNYGSQGFFKRTKTALQQESQIEEAINSAIKKFLPFVNVVSIDSVFSDRNTVGVSIRFSLASDASEEEQLALDFGNYEPVDII